MPFKLTARVGPKVRKERYETLDEALAALSGAIDDVSGASTRNVLGREYSPVAQVSGRFEIAGPDGVRGGIDVRGDGSAEAYVGRMRKRLVERRDRESAVEALGRELSG